MRFMRFVNRNRPIILMYHRILSNPLLPGISPEIFAQQLAYIKDRFRVIPINQMVEELNTNSLKPYSVAITFDDGHGDFYTTAWPLLKRYNLPASLYVTTGFVDHQTWLWPDLLRYVLLQGIGTEVQVEDLGRLSIDKSQVLETWGKLGDLCLKLTSEERWSFIAQLATQLKVDIDRSPKDPFAPVTWDQLREMQSEGLDVGSHSITHPILSVLSKETLMTELRGSQQRILEELGKLPTGICYPNGMAKDTSTLVETQAQELYRYGLVAYPCDIRADQVMHLGRWATTATINRFKQVMNGLSRNDNHNGEYR